MLPFLVPVLGRGKLGNFLIRNKWRNYDAIKKLQHMPMLMLSAGQVQALPGVLIQAALMSARGGLCKGVLGSRLGLVLEHALRMLL